MTENWGSEFSDDGSYGKQNPEILLPGTYLPIDLLIEIADRRLIAIARNDIGFVELRSSIQALGLLEPGVCYSDGRNLRFQDGYHRLVACSDLGYSTFPVHLLHSDSRIRANAMSLEELVFRLLNQL